MRDIVTVTVPQSAEALDSVEVPADILAIGIEDGQKIRVTGEKNHVRESLLDAGLDEDEVTRIMETAMHATLLYAFGEN